MTSFSCMKSMRIFSLNEVTIANLCALKRILLYSLEGAVLIVSVIAHCLSSLRDRCFDVASYKNCVEFVVVSQRIRDMTTTASSAGPSLGTVQCNCNLYRSVAVISLPGNNFFSFSSPPFESD